MATLNPWPKSANSAIFLLDAHNSTERKIMERAVREHAAGRRYKCVALSVGVKTLTKPNFAGISATFGDDKQQYYVPLRVSWESPSEVPSDTPSLLKLLLQRSTASADFLQQFKHRRNPDACQIVVAKSATLANLEQRQRTSSNSADLAHLIARAAYLALDRAERHLTGTRYRIPRMVSDEVINRPRLAQALEEMAEATGTPVEKLRKHAKACLKEMAATPTTAGIDLAASLGRYMYTRGFDKDIDFAPGDVERIRQLLAERPVAFLFTHKSHIDGFLLITLFHDLNLTPLHTFGGINMGFMGLGSLLRNAGAIFIRRSFKGDDVYKLVFKNYIDYLGEKRFPLMWALEGTRSRTGKLMPPRFGLLNYVVDAYMRDNAPDLVLMPISIIYDQVPEVGDYDLLQAGGKKRPENASWFMQYISGLNMPHGKLHVRFGQGIEISDYIDASSGRGSVDRRDMQKIAFDLAVDVNQATPITVNALITYVMLAHGHRAITFEELYHELCLLLNHIEQFAIPATDDARKLDRSALTTSLSQLATTGVITIAEDGIEVVYMIPHERGRKAAYYRNGLIHFFINSAIGEVALLAVTATGDKAIAQFHAAALNIRDLLKYEFFFEGSEAFIKSLEQEFDRRMPTWRSALTEGKEAIRQLLQSTDLLLGHATLRPFMEAYWVFARALIMSPQDSAVEPKALIEKSLSLGKQRVLQQRIHCEESVSGSYFENAVKIAEGRNLLIADAAAIAGRDTLWQELRDINSNIRFLASVMETKRLEKL